MKTTLHYLATNFNIVNIFSVSLHYQLLEMSSNHSQTVDTQYESKMKYFVDIQVDYNCFCSTAYENHVF